MSGNSQEIEEKTHCFIGGLGWGQRMESPVRAYEKQALIIGGIRFNEV